MQRWLQEHPRAWIESVPRYPVGTFHVELLCLCKGNARYYSRRCPDQTKHGVWAEQDWYSIPPVFEEPYMTSARDYHDQHMRSVHAGRSPEPDAGV